MVRSRGGEERASLTPPGASVILAAFAAFLLFRSPAPLSAAEPGLRTRNVILVTADGLRHQELFGGLDPAIMESKFKSGAENLERLAEEYGGETPAASRERIFPFFWSRIVPEGAVAGNVAEGSRAVVRNPHKVSYPGYAEILTGHPVAGIEGNKPIPNPLPTVLEVVKDRLALGRREVAAYCSWTVFNPMIERDNDAVICNAGYEDVDPEVMTEGMKTLNALQHEMLTPWDTVRFDSVTFGLALEHLKTWKPRLLYIALGETDDWAHERRYDRTIRTARLFDDSLRTLWETVQSMEEYRDRTTLIITTDHGRGRTPDDWIHHKSTVEGAEEIWIAVMGPDTPATGETGVGKVYSQGQVAATVARFMGVDLQALRPDAEPPLDFAFAPAGR